MASYRFDLNYAIALGCALSQPGSSDSDKQLAITLGFTLAAPSSDSDKQLADRVFECAKNYRLRDGKPKVDVDLTEQEAVTVRALLPKLTNLAQSISDELKASGCKWPADAAERQDEEAY
ncbi:MAG: hypothetical protein ACLP07_02475 [Terracidiphilus sp.]